MKPKDLKHPIAWEERRPLIYDGVFFVPDFYHEHEQFIFPEWESVEIFGNDRPVSVEYCSGNGKWIIERAQAEPQKNWVALEKRFDRVRKIWSKAKNEGIENLFIVCGEGLTWTKNYLRDATVDATFVNFPDPWPKDRHAKHRIIQAPFAHQLERILKDDGIATLVTDDKTYSEQMMEVMGGIKAFELAFDGDNDNYGSSYFNDLWRELGREIRHMHFQKKNHPKVSLND